MDILNFDNTPIVALRNEINSLGSSLENVHEKAVQLNDAIKDSTNGNKIKESKQSVDSLEKGFTSAIKSAKGFNDVLDTGLSNAIGRVEGLGDIVEGVSGALPALSKGFSTLKTTFLSLNVAMLANPIFLLGGVIVGVTVGLVALLNKLGVLTSIFEGLSSIVNIAIQGFKNLTDFLGFTSYAAQEAYDTVKKGEESTRKEIEKSSKERIQYAKTLEGLSEEQIENIEKSAGVEIDSIQSVDEIRLESAKQLQESYLKEINALQELETKKGSLSKDEQKSLDDLKNKYQETSLEIVSIESERAKKLIDLEEKVSSKRLELFGTIEEKYADQRNKLLEETKVAQEKLFKELNSIAGQGKIEREKQIQAEIEANNELLKLSKEEIKRNEQKDLQDRNKEYISQLKTRAEQEIEEIKRLERIKIKQTEDGSLNQAIAVLNSEKIILKAYQDRAKSLGLSQSELTEFVLDQNKKIEEAAKKVQSLSPINIGETITTIPIKVDLIPSDNNKAYVDLAKQAMMQVAAVDQFTTKMFEENAKKRAELLQQSINASFSIANESLNAFNSLIDLSFTLKKKNLEKGSKEEEIAAKKEFEIRKKVSIAGAVISGIQGVVNILSAASTIPQPFDAVYKGVQIAALAAATASNIAKISSSKFEGGSASIGGTSTTSTPTVNTNAVPNFNLFGQGNNQNTVIASPQVITQQNQEIRVVATVSETEITATQLRINKMQESAEL